MKIKLNRKSLDILIDQFISKNGQIQKCKPKLAPKKRKSTKSIPTKSYINECLGYLNHPSNIFLNKYL